MMKTQITFLTFTLFSVAFTFGQQQNTPTKQSKTTVVKTTTQVAPTKSLEQINYELNAIKIKTEYVKSHPEEMEIAKKEHWFEDMEIYRKTLEKQKAVLLSQNKTSQTK